MKHSNLIFVWIELVW